MLLLCVMSSKFRQITMLLLLVLGLVGAAGCKVVKDTIGVGDVEAYNKFQNLMVVLDANKLYNITVGAVVDVSKYDIKDPVLLQDTVSRTERRVRNAVVNNLNEKGQFFIRSAGIKESDEIRNFIKKMNTGSLDPDSAKNLGKKMMADTILNVIIDDQGRRVTLYVITVNNGIELFNKTLYDWNYARLDTNEKKPPKEEKPKTEEEEAAQ